MTFVGITAGARGEHARVAPTEHNAYQIVLVLDRPSVGPLYSACARGGAGAGAILVTRGGSGRRFTGYVQLNGFIARETTFF